MANGYMEKILRVDLSKNEVREEPFPEDWKKKYLGGSGVGARIIYDEYARLLRCLVVGSLLVG